MWESGGKGRFLCLPTILKLLRTYTQGDGLRITRFYIALILYLNK